MIRSSAGRVIPATVDDEAAAGLADPEALCARVAQAMPGVARSLVAVVGEHRTTIVLAIGHRPALIWTVPHAPLVGVTERADETRPLGRELVQTLREGVRAALAEARVGMMRRLRCEVFAASRLGSAVVTLGAAGGREASARELAAALATLGATWEEQSSRGGGPAWLRTTLIAAAVLEGVLKSLGGGMVLSLPEDVYDGAGSALGRSPA